VVRASSQCVTCRLACLDGCAQARSPAMNLLSVSATVLCLAVTLAGALLHARARGSWAANARWCVAERACELWGDLGLFSGAAYQTAHGRGGVPGLLRKACGCAQASVEGGARTVVVFEEVDNLADADRGFLSALAALIAESKARRPAGRRSPCRVVPLLPATAGVVHARCCRRLSRAEAPVVTRSGPSCSSPTRRRCRRRWPGRGCGTCPSAARRRRRPPRCSRASARPRASPRGLRRCARWWQPAAATSGLPLSQQAHAEWMWSGALKALACQLFLSEQMASLCVLCGTACLLAPASCDGLGDAARRSTHVRA